MRAFLATFALTAQLVLTQAVPLRLDEVRELNSRIDELRRTRQPTLFGEPRRHPRDIKVDPKTGTVSGDYPVGGGKIFGTVQGDDGRFGYKRNVFDNEHGTLDASAYHGRSLGAAPSSRAGGRLDWHDDYARGSADVARDLRGGPTTLNAAGGGTWPLSKNWDASAQGTYSQTFGRGRPDFGVLGSINGRF